MKRIILLAAVIMAFASNTKAQDLNMAVGANINAGVGDYYNNGGFGFKYQYNFTDHWRGEASYNQFISNDNIRMWDVNANVHYVFHIKDSKFSVYPLAGLTVRGTRFHDSEWTYIPDVGFVQVDMKSRSAGFGANYGVGAEYQLSKNVKLNAEVKGQSAKGWFATNRGIFSVGASYCF